MERKTRARGAAVLFALGTLLAGMMLMASPAGASGHGGHDDTSRSSGDALAAHDSTASGGCVAAHGSVCSGSGLAVHGSVSSGDAVAVDGSVASGCSAAFHDSTASGGECAPKAHAKPDHKPEHRRHHGHGGHVAEAPAATPTGAVELAFTGSSTGPLAAAGALALALGLVLVALASERRRPVHSS